jgi:3-deoxy-7-phosphoheptulonate synthase
VDSWKARAAGGRHHTYLYEDEAATERAVERIRGLPPLVTSGEIERLRGLIAEAQRGERFLVQGGDCAERVADCRPDAITGTMKILLQVSLVLLHASRRPVIRVGRWAGQYAKPRTSETETRVGAEGRAVTLPSYFGDLVNGEAFTPEARRPDPARMVEGYVHAGLTLNFVRSLVDGGFADIHHPENWDLSFLRRAGLPPGLRAEYEAMREGMLRWLAEVEQGRAATPRRGGVEELERVEFFASHEGLNLLYESAQTRRVPRRDGWYDLTTHLPWIGERTRSPDGPHAEFFRGVRNPVGVKVGPRAARADGPGGADELVRLLDVLNPGNEEGKIVLIARMGSSRVREALGRVVERVGREGRRVLWVCDPMHGNTVLVGADRGRQSADSGRGSAGATGTKTRSFAAIVEEVEATWEVHRALGTRLGGIHLEVTGEDVTECVGGASGVREEDLPRRYETACDPRLNYEQAMELAFAVGRRIGR